MAEGNPITYVNGLHANNDAKFFEDVYIYGNLYYDLDGQDNFKVDSLIVNTQSDLNNLYVSGILLLLVLIFFLVVVISLVLLVLYNL